MLPPGKHTVNVGPLASQWRTFGTFIRVIKRWEDEREVAQSESESEEELMECAVMWPTAAALLSPPLTAVINDVGRRGRRLSGELGVKGGDMEEGMMEGWRKEGRMEEGWEERQKDARRL